MSLIYIVEEDVPDLVILDVMLPDENGYDIVKKIRKTPNTKKLPVIMVTAKTQEIDMIKGFDDGADDYIKKPFSAIHSAKIELESEVGRGTTIKVEF